MPRRFKEHPFPTVRQAFVWAGGMLVKNANGEIETDDPTAIWLLKRNGWVEVVDETPEVPTDPENGGDAGDGTEEGGEVTP